MADRIESIFAAAVELPPEKRAAFLDQECSGDAVLRERLLVLLQAHERAGHMLDRPADVDRTGAFESSAGVGTIIAGRYKLLEEVGEGGMGTVWVAEQIEPVKRKVALKLIKAGMDSKQVLARFEAERQALAVMDHPNIAKVLDGGIVGQSSGSRETSDPHGTLTSSAMGRPFFVMEYVKGVPITEYCDAVRLNVEDRLQLFTQVCSAVQHAHQKGIIHRDLKPSNILVAPYDDKPVPKVIDFGLAKAMHQSLTEKTLHTAHDAVLGTPLYMSPEQAQLNNLDVDTRSDIYSLGVLLYELLTGTTPLEKQRFKEAAWDEIKRIIREEDPPRPSTRLSSANTLPSLAASRQSEPAKLTRLVRGDLDWIVMKALEKDRTRRYETANGFAMDVQRYLTGEPVNAHPPSMGYRLKKFVRKNQTAIVIAFMFAVSLKTATFISIWFASRAAIAETIAIQERDVAERLRGEEAKQRLIAEAEKKKAEDAEAQTLADYRASTDEAIEHLIGSKPELGPQEKTYLENTLQRWQAYAARQGDDERSWAIRGEGHYRVAVLWQTLGRKEEARAEYEAARDLQKKLVERFPGVPKHQQALADTLNNLGILLNELGKRDAARVEHLAARDFQQKLVEKFPDEPAYQSSLAMTHNNLGYLFANLGKQDEARLSFQAARDLQKKLVGHFPLVAGHLRRLAMTQNNLGQVLAGLGRREEALAEYQASRATFMQLVERFPAEPAYRQALGTIHNGLGVLFADLDKNEEARAEYEAARDVQKKLVKEFPAVPGYQHDLALTHNSLANLLFDLGKHDEAQAEHKAAQAIQKKLVEQFPAVPLYRIDLGMSYFNYGNQIGKSGDPAGSLEWFELAIQMLKPVHDKNPRDPNASSCLRNTHGSRAYAHELLRKYAEAISDLDRAVELSPPAERPRYRASRATCYIQASKVAEAVAEVAELTKMSNWNARQWYDFASVYAVASGKIADKKREYAARAMELLQKAVTAGFKDASHMKQDKHLDAIRGREDFKKLLAELEAKVEKK